MASSFFEKRMVIGDLLCGMEVSSQASRLAQVDVLRLVVRGRVVVAEQADHARHGAGHVHLPVAEQRHLVQAELAGGNRRNSASRSSVQVKITLTKLFGSARCRPISSVIAVVAPMIDSRRCARLGPRLGFPRDGQS